MLFNSFYQFHAHSSVVVRTFPESSLVVIPVDASVCPDAPEPITVFPVDDVVLDEFPAMDGIFNTLLIASELPEVEITYNTFGLHPPVTVRIGMVTGIVPLIYHSSFGTESLACRLCNRRQARDSVPKEE